MTFEEVSGSNSTALPYIGDEFARLVNQYETDAFVHMIQNVANVISLDITIKWVEQVRHLF